MVNRSETFKKCSEQNVTKINVTKCYKMFQ